MAIGTTNLANGNFNSVASTLGNYNYTKSATLNTGLRALLTSSEQGQMLRVNGFPENFISPIRSWRLRITPPTSTYRTTIRCRCR